MRAGPFLVGLVVMGCEPLQSTGGEEEGPASGAQTALVVSPAGIDFGSVSALSLAGAQQHFTVTNAGELPLAVHGHDEVVALEGSGGAFSIESDPYFELLPGEQRELNIRFRPDTDGVWSGEVRVNYGLESLWLVGEGRAPVLEVTTEAAEPTAFGCVDVGEVMLENVGSLDLTVSGWEIEGAAAWSVDPVAGLTVEPGARFAVPLRFAPDWDGLPGGARDAVLTLVTNDPQQPSLRLRLEGLAYEGELVSDAFVYRPETVADILLVADTEATLGAYVRTRGVEALGPMLDALDEANVNHHIAALTGGDSCPASLPSYASSSRSPNYRSRTVESALVDGVAGDGDGVLLKHASSSLGLSCFDGFLRDGAQLHVVAVAGGPHEGMGTPFALAASLLAGLGDAAPLASEVVVSAVAAAETAACAGASYGAVYIDAALASGGSLVELCQEDWGPGFAALAGVSAASAEGSLSRALEQVPLPSSIEVTVDGTRFTGWTYNGETNAIDFLESEAPPAGSAVIIDYMREVACAE